MIHREYTSTTRSLQRDSLPMRLFEKAKRLGVWNPSDIDLSQDIRDWECLSNEEKDLLLRLTALFQDGEEAVTLHLLPLIMTIAHEGRLEEELFLTTFLWEEAKHTDYFRRFLDEVAHEASDLSHYHTPHYRAIMYEALPTALQRLRSDSSPAAQAEAALIYTIIVEGVLAETGYYGALLLLERAQILPGHRRSLTLLKQDESRHIAYGIFLLSRLIAEDDRLWNLVENKLNTLILLAVGVITEVFACYDHPPFDITARDFVTYALSKFQKRVDHLRQARGRMPSEIYRMTQPDID